MSECSLAALAYAAKGWPVFPLLPNKKTPATPHGFKDATTDPALIAQFPNGNLAIRTGNGLCVLDIDPRHDGEATLQTWEAAHSPLPRTYTVKTWSGGHHYYFICSTPLKSRNPLGAGVDFKAEGGYVVTPPSAIDGRPYLLEDDQPLAPAPDWLLALVKTPLKTKRIFEKGARNVSLTSVAGAMRRVGVEGQALTAAMTAINATLPEPLPAAEVATISGSISQYPPAETPPWVTYHVPMTQKSQPICNADAALQILEQHPLFADAIWFETFSGRIMTSWEHPRMAEWTEGDTQRLLIFLQRQIRLSKMAKSSVEDALAVYAAAHPRHAVIDWIKTLAWDGTPRLETWLTTFFGVADTAYARAAGRNVWMGLMARLHHPGCQMDHMLILEGPQNLGKTKALRILGGEWYASMSASVMDKDFFQSLQGKLIIEIPEMESFRGFAEMNRIKSIITTPVDHYRAAYGRRVLSYPRQCLFFGTTNEEYYLRDMTGARRFWPVRCDQIDIAALEVARDQLFAEAWSAFRPGLTWWEMPETTQEEQEARREEDAWEVPIADYLLLHEEVTIKDVLCEGVNVPLGQINRADALRCASILRKLRWEKKRIRKGDKHFWRWIAPIRQPGEDLAVEDFGGTIDV